MAKKIIPEEKTYYEYLEINLYHLVKDNTNPALDQINCDLYMNQANEHFNNNEIDVDMYLQSIDLITKVKIKLKKIEESRGNT